MDDIRGMESVGGADSPAVPARAQLFLSHASEDADAVRELATHLRAGGVRVWLDLDEIRPGDDWMARLEDGLLQSDHYAVYIGRLGIANWVSRELRVALDRNVKNAGYRIIPILGQGADPHALPLFLRQHHWLDLRDTRADPGSIVGHVLQILGLPAVSAATGEAPFIGLKAFDTEHAHLFFGRDQEIAELLARVSRAPFLTMIGDSGSGKSSLLRAGLLPSLRSGTHLAGGAEAPVWRVLVMRPGARPFRELASALAGLRPDHDAATRLELTTQCHARLTQDAAGLSLCLASLADAGERTVLAIDQFEELFTLVHDENLRRQFIHALLQAANTDTERPVHVVITLRADFYPQCLNDAALSRAVTQDQYAVLPIQGERLVDVIVKPAARTGVVLEKGLVEAILSDLGTDGANLPLLEHTLLQLWNRRSSNLLTHAAYETIGRIQGALEHHAEEVFDRFSASEQQHARNLILKLVQPGWMGRATGTRANREQLLPSGSAQGEAERVLAELVRQRAVSIYSTGHDEEEYGITHEALLDSWNRVQGWLQEDREFLLWRQRLQNAQSDWQAAGGDAGGLLRGSPLAEALRWHRQRAADIDRAAAAFIAASARRESRVRWLKRSAVGALTMLSTIAVGAALIANRSREQAEISLQLATSAVDEMLVRVGAESLRDLPQLEQVRKELFEEARVLYQRLADMQAGAANLQVQAAVAPARIARIDWQLGDLPAASRGLSQAIARLEALAAAQPDAPALQAELAALEHELGRVQAAMARTREEALRAEALFSRALQMQQAVLAREPDNIPFRLEYARIHLNRGILYKDGLLDSPNARTDLLQAIALVEALPAAAAVPDGIQHLARSNNTLANLMSDAGEMTSAFERYARAAEHFEALHARDPTNREYRLELAKTWNNLALLSRRVPRHGDVGTEQTPDYNTRAIALLNELANPLPEYRVELANAYDTRGRILQDGNDHASAIRVFRQAQPLLQSLLREFPDNLQYRYRYAVLLTNLGFSQIRDSRFDALPETQRHLAELEPLLTEDNRETLEEQASYQLVRRWN